MSVSLQCLRARWILPIVGTPIEDGEVVVEDGRIAEVRPAQAMQLIRFA